MRFKFMTVAAALALLTGFAGTSVADQGYSKSIVNVRSGPGVNYPVIDKISANRLVNINGCVSTWRWCEVEMRGTQGWVYADNLQGIYNGRRVPIASYGPRLDIPVLTVNDREYFDRDRDHWRNDDQRRYRDDDYRRRDESIQWRNDREEYLRGRRYYNN